MTRFLLAAALSLWALAMPAQAQVSVSIGQPGFYGRIDLGGLPEPALLYPQPTIIRPVPVHRPPLYLHVPQGHAQHWHKHCGRYRACGERVYFVRDDWYQREYVPHYPRRHNTHHHHEYRDDHHDDRHRHGHRRERD